MKDFISKLKIPTILGLGVIISGIVAGVFLTLREQDFISKASPDQTAQNITVSNLSDDSVTISWQTATPVASFIKLGQSNINDQTILDDRDNKTPIAHPIHYVTIKNLLPKTSYQYRIVSGKISSDILNFTTAAPLSSQTGFGPIIGSVSDGDEPLNEGIAYLSISDATIQSAKIVASGNFLIPISQIRKSDLSEIYPLIEGLDAKLIIVSDKGNASIIFKIRVPSQPLPPIKLGQNLDLSTPEPEVFLNKYDLNNDGKINAADNAIILQDFGKNPKNIKADLNGDGVVNQKDLDLMSKQINQ